MFDIANTGWIVRF